MKKIYGEHLLINNPKQLKELLSNLKNENFVNLSNIDIDMLINGMLKNIGSIDSELRDHLIYESFYHLSLKTDVLNNKYRHILQVCIDDDHLFYKIGEANTDSVFTRSFSVLILPFVLYYHRKNPTFTNNEIKDVYKTVKKYFLEEKDLRGYVPEKGWAHSAAHTADVLDELALCTEIEHDELKEILSIIRTKTLDSNYVFINREDERMVTAVVSIFNRHLLSDQEIAQWIKDFLPYTKTGNLQYDMNLNVNVRNLLRSLYFRLLNLNEFNHLNQEIIDVLTYLHDNI